MSSLSGKRAIVTGASGAFGRSIMGELHRQGARAVGLDLAPSDEPDARVLACDITDALSVEEAAGEAIKLLGGLDVLVSNAGLGGPADAGAQPDEAAVRMIDVNLVGAWRATAACIDALVESRGRVIFVGSRMVYVPVPLGAPYGASKRGLAAYADSLRLEYGTHIQVCTVHPSMVRTPIHDAAARAGLSLQGVSREEPLDGVVGRIIHACEVDRVGRELATTRRGAAEIFIGRHFPALADRMVRRVIRKQVAAGTFDGAQMAAGLAERYR